MLVCNADGCKTRNNRRRLLSFFAFPAPSHHKFFLLPSRDKNVSLQESGADIELLLCDRNVPGRPRRDVAHT